MAVNVPGVRGRMRTGHSMANDILYLVLYSFKIQHMQVESFVLASDALLTCEGC